MAFWQTDAGSKRMTEIAGCVTLSAKACLKTAVHHRIDLFCGGVLWAADRPAWTQEVPNDQHRPTRKLAAQTETDTVSHRSHCQQHEKRLGPVIVVCVSMMAQ